MKLEIHPLWLSQGALSMCVHLQDTPLYRAALFYWEEEAQYASGFSMRGYKSSNHAHAFVHADVLILGYNLMSSGCYFSDTRLRYLEVKRYQNTQQKHPQTSGA